MCKVGSPWLLHRAPVGRTESPTDLSGSLLCASALCRARPALHSVATTSSTQITPRTVPGCCSMCPEWPDLCVLTTVPESVHAKAGFCRRLRRRLEEGRVRLACVCEMRGLERIISFVSVVLCLCRRESGCAGHTGGRMQCGAQPLHSLHSSSLLLL